MRRLFLVLVLFAACSSPKLDGPPPSSWPPVPADAVKSRVLRVVDGDTVVLADIEFGTVDSSTRGRKARLVGVDTPEVFGGKDCFGPEASAFTHERLDGAEVRVAFDADPVDRFGRALVYIWTADDRLFNATLVNEGFASQLTIPPNVEFAELFRTLVADARNANRGLWAGCK